MGVYACDDARRVVLHTIERAQSYLVVRVGVPRFFLHDFHLQRRRQPRRRQVRRRRVRRRRALHHSAHPSLRLTRQNIQSSAPSNRDASLRGTTLPRRHPTVAPMASQDMHVHHCCMLSAIYRDEQRIASGQDMDVHANHLHGVFCLVASLAEGVASSTLPIYS